MRLLYIHQYFVFPDSPGATRSYDLATSFQKHGYKVTVITSSSFINGEFNKRWTILQRDGLEVHVLRSNYSNQLSFLKRVLLFLGFMFSSMSRALKIKADVVLATSTPITVVVPALLKKTLQRTPFIFEVRDVWPEAPIALGAIKNRLLIGIIERFEKHAYREASHVVALSSDMKKSIVTRTNTPAQKVTVIPNISAIERFSNYGNSSILREQIGFIPQRSLLYAGTFGLVNGLAALIELARETKHVDPHLKYIVIGWGREKEKLVELAREYDLLDSTVYFLRPLPKNIMPQLYRECTVTSSFVVPVKELWANSANKFFDSLAAGKPVVINYGGWQAEEIRQKNIGYILDTTNNDMRTLAAKFCAYMNNDQVIQEQSRNALKVAKEEYSLESAVNKYLHILEKLS